MRHLFMVITILLGACLSDSTSTSMDNVPMTNLQGNPTLQLLASSCMADVDCASGHCEDIDPLSGIGICCNSACGGVSDCQSCLNMLTGAGDGNCAVIKLHPIPNKTYTCRPIYNSMGLRHPGIHGSMASPLDAHDVGGSALLGDAPCDMREYCDGISTACPSDTKGPSSSIECRAPISSCDIREWCDGVHNDCPADQFYSIGQGCTAMHECEEPGICDALHVCVSGVPSSSTRKCFPQAVAVNDSDCHKVTTCNGALTCPDLLQSDGTTCHRRTGLDCGKCIAGICTGPYTGYPTVSCP